MTNKVHTKVETAVAALVQAIEQLRYDGSKRPATDQLRMAWPDLGRVWIAGWARELGRDPRTIAIDLGASAEAPSEDEALMPLENALWRLGAAREKLHAVVALAFGIPSLKIGEDKKQTLSFRPASETCRAKLRELQTTHEPARRILDLDGKLRQSLLLRHQATHSLAPLVKSHSLTWFEAALIDRGGVNHYIALHLPPKGLEGLEATLELARLLAAAAELEPPPIIWKATETNQCFDSRSEASDISRAAAEAAGDV